MTTYCGHSNAPVEYATKEEEKNKRCRENLAELVVNTIDELIKYEEK